jgi:hypothetical protein
MSEKMSKKGEVGSGMARRINNGLRMSEMGRVFMFGRTWSGSG